MVTAKNSVDARHGYKFDVDLILTDFEGRPAFAVMAMPTEYPSTGKRSFFIDETGVLRGEDNHGLETSRNAPALGPSSDYSDARSLTRGWSNTSDDYQLQAKYIVRMGRRFLRSAAVLCSGPGNLEADTLSQPVI